MRHFWWFSNTVLERRFRFALEIEIICDLLFLVFFFGTAVLMPIGITLILMKFVGLATTSGPEDGNVDVKPIISVLTSSYVQKETDSKKSLHFYHVWQFQSAASSAWGAATFRSFFYLCSSLRQHFPLCWLFFPRAKNSQNAAALEMRQPVAKGKSGWGFGKHGFCVFRIFFCSFAWKHKMMKLLKIIENALLYHLLHYILKSLEIDEK